MVELGGEGDRRLGESVLERDLEIGRLGEGFFSITCCLKHRRTCLHSCFPGGKGVGFTKVLRDRTVGGSPFSSPVEYLLGQHLCFV
jgi:hypothetical protein